MVFMRMIQKIEKVQFVSARNKLKYYDGPVIECTLKSKYSRTKFLSKEYTKYYLKDDEKNLSFFNSNKKKDDLADSFMQGLSFIISS